MQSRTSHPKRKSMNQQYEKQRNFHRRSVHVNILHNPIVPHHFDRTTHKKPQNQENHLENSQHQNTSSYTVIKRINKPVIRYPNVQEEISQFNEGESSSNSDLCGRTMDDISKRYEYCVRHSGQNNDRSMPISIQKKGKFFPQNKVQNYESQYLRIGKNYPQRLQTLELENSFEQQERENHYHNTKPQIIPNQQLYVHNTQKKQKKTEQEVPRRKSTNDYQKIGKRQDFEEQYFVIKKSPKISSKNNHFVEYTPLSKESEDILEEIQRLYMNSEDENVRIIRQIPQKNTKKITSPKRSSYFHQNQYQQQYFNEQNEILENQRNLQKQIQQRFKDIQNIIQVQNMNLKNHNNYLVNMIKKLQNKNRLQYQQILKQNLQIKQLKEQKNAYMERCLQLQNCTKLSNKQSISYYLQNNSTDCDIQNETINIYENRNNQKLQNLRKYFQNTLQPSIKQENFKNSNNMKKIQNIDPTPKFSSTRQSPQQIRYKEPKNEELLFDQENSDIFNENEQKDEWTNANSGFSMVRNLANNIPVNFYTQEMNEQQKSECISDESEQKIGRYYTQPPNTPLPFNFVSKIDILNEEFNDLMREYKISRDVRIRKECVEIARKIKELKDQRFNQINITDQKYNQNKFKKLESLEMEIEQNQMKNKNKIQISKFISH